MAHTGLPSIEKLKGRENYDSWKFAVQAYLELEDLWTCVQSEGEADLKKVARARAKIILLVDPVNFVHIQSTKTAKEAWDNLQKAFQDNGLTRRVGLLKKLITTRLENCSSVEDYVNSIITTAHKLDGVGLSVSEEWVGTILLAGLSDEYKPMIMGIESSGVAITGDAIKTKILQDVKTEDTADTVAFYGRSGSKKLTKKKSFNNKNGNSGNKNGGNAGPRCFQCNNHGHFARDCPSKQQSNKRVQGNSNVLCTSFAVSSVQPGEWYIDSGASAHMCTDPKLLSDFSQPTKSEVVVANNMRLTVQSAGNVYLPIAAQDDKIKVENVLCIPELCANLLSVSQIVSKNNKVVFDAKGCRIYNSQKQLIATASLDGELFKLDKSRQDRCFVADKSESDYKLWHRRLGHLNMSSVRMLSDRFGGSTKFPMLDKWNCEICLKGKQCRFPFNQTGPRATEVLEVIHSDLCGPLNVRSMGGARYILVFVDDFTRKTFVYFLQSKHETVTRFAEFKALVENQCNKFIKVLHTDNGSEYCNKAFQTLLRKSGIYHRTSAPYTPEHNGLVERMNRTIIEKARCMLLDANLPKSFWAEAVSTAVHIINRSPCNSSLQMVPEEAWSGKKPDMNHLRAFGCKAMVHIPKERRKKLDPKSEACIFVGYCEDSHTFRLYHPVKKRIITSRDVIFFEYEQISPKKVIENFNLFHFPEFLIGGDDSVGEDNDISISQPISEEVNIPHSMSDTNEKDDILTSESSEDVKIPDSMSDETSMHAPRRSQRTRKLIMRDGCITYAVTTGECHDPFTLKEALERADSKLWRQAMNEEIDSLRENCTWNLVDLPVDKRAINCKWVFKTKRDSEGKISRYKARLVVKGCAQRKGIDYEETFSPVVRYSTIRFLFSLAAQLDLDIDQMDAVTAFLQGDLNENIYMLQPEGFSDNTGKVCHLKKSLYGLKQASRMWNQKLDTALIKYGLRKSKIDPCVYFSVEDSNYIIVAVYVDDLLIFTKNVEVKNKLKMYLNSNFKMKDMGEARFVLGMQIQRDRTKGTIYIDQKRYINDILTRFNMTECNPASTPMDSNQKLTKLMCPQTEEEKNEMMQIPYQEAVGSIMFAAQVSRPDVSFAVSNVSRFNNCYGKPHWTAVKRILRYLKGTSDTKLEFSKTKNNTVVGYCDADWANDGDDRRSVTGYIFKSGGGAISWNTKRQPTVALSSTEAEYMAVSSATQEALWLKGLEAELIPSSPKSTIIHCDNKGAISLALTNAYHPRTKHIDVRHHFVRDKIDEGLINLKYISTADMNADFLTKPLDFKKHNLCAKAIGLKFS